MILHELNIKLLEDTFYRIVKLFDDHSNLKICISKSNLFFPIQFMFPDVPAVIDFWPRSVLCDERKASFLSDLHRDMFDFLFKHTESNGTIDNWSSLSIFRICNVFDINLSKGNRLTMHLAKEFGKSKAAETVRSIGYCSSLEELALRMDLIGV